MPSAAQPASPASPTARLAQLIRWWPLRLLAVAAVVAAAVPATRSLMHPWPSGASGVEIDMAGAGGEVSDGRYAVEAPVWIANHSQHMIGRVSLWVDAYACRAGARCERVLSTEQSLPMRLMPGGSASFSTHFTGGLPARLAGAKIEVVRYLTGVEDETDQSRERMRRDIAEGH